MTRSWPLPGDEGAGSAMAGCWVTFYGVWCAEKMLCGRQWADHLWQEMPSHPVLLTGAGGRRFGGLAKDMAQLPAVLASCNKLQECPDLPQRRSKAQVSSARAGLWDCQVFHSSTPEDGGEWRGWQTEISVV